MDKDQEKQPVQYEHPTPYEPEEFDEIIKSYESEQEESEIGLQYYFIINSINYN
jgi:hypothetical protein